MEAPPAARRASDRGCGGTVFPRQGRRGRSPREAPPEGPGKCVHTSIRGYVVWTGERDRGKMNSKSEFYHGGGCDACHAA